MRTMKRRLIQLCSALLYNLNLKGFAQVSIYQGRAKGLCVPGLNCYSCPGAVGSCPLGTLQNSLAALDRKMPFYILGVLLLLGVTLGRTICGFLCPFGLVQELLYKIPVPKLKKNRVTRILSKLKYVILIVFVILLPIVFKMATRLPVPAFCKYICPAGTLEGGIPLVLLDESLGSLAGALFSWKVLVMAAILISACFIYRSFCRFLCPLGAVYSLFAPVAMLGVRIDDGACTSCGRCVRTCKMDIKNVGDMECIQCGECMKECGVDAIHWKKPFRS
ncbi:4Fe-4S binding domain protein [Clostridiales bacterium 1_7_47FAA]|nr:4Fe-4S binding domain protein [Clostridiales bacterium 1_7_47FAA]